MKLIARMKQPTEADFQQQVIDLARLLGWRVAHFRPGLNKRGKWQTAVAADGAGFPDLVMAKPGLSVIFAELKVGKNRLSLAQEQWIFTLRQAGTRAYCWFPSDWNDIENILREGT